MKKYDLSEDAVVKHFTRTVNQINKKYGVTIIKEGRGDKATYYEVSSYNGIAKSIEFIKDIHKEIVMEKATFSNLIDWDFMVFLGIITCPMFSFRGTPADFLEYVGIVNKSESNIERLKETFLSLQSKGYVKYIEDHSTDEGYFNVFIIRDAEIGMKIGIDMIQRCIRLQKENSMNSWVPLLKTWVGLQIIVFEDENVWDGKKTLFTLDELERVTGINRKMLTKCKKILEEDKLFQTSRAYKYIKDGYKCLGQKIQLNGAEYDYRKVVN